MIILERNKEVWSNKKFTPKFQAYSDVYPSLIGLGQTELKALEELKKKITAHKI